MKAQKDGWAIQDLTIIKKLSWPTLFSPIATFYQQAIRNGLNQTKPLKKEKRIDLDGTTAQNVTLLITMWYSCLEEVSFFFFLI